MPNNIQGGLGYHVITYVERDGLPDAEVVAHGQLKVAADPRQQVEGDATKAVLSKAEHVQCHGEKGTDGCNQVHNYAEERVISRLTDDGVGVVWRRYHPLVAKGKAKPDSAFEAEADGVKVRVEVRQVVDSDKDLFTPKEISTTALARVEADLQKQQQQVEYRNQVREQLRQFEEGQVAPAREQIEALADRLATLPCKDAVAAAKEKALGSLEDAAERASQNVRQLIGSPDINQNAQNEAQQTINAARPEIQNAIAPLQELEQANQALIGWADGVIAERDRIEALGDDWKTQRRERLLGLPEEPPELAALQDELAGLQAQGNAPDALDHLAELQQQLATLKQHIDEAQAPIDARIEQESALEDAFQARVDGVLRWLPGSEQSKALADFIAAGAAFPGFGVAHWQSEAEKVLAQTGKSVSKVGGLAYHKPQDQKTLEAAEQKLGPALEFMAKLKAELVKRAEGVYVQMELGGAPLTPPSGYLKCLSRGDDGAMKVEVGIRNNDARAILVGFNDAEGEVRQITLTGKGALAKFSAEDVHGPCSFSIIGVLDGPANVADGVRMTRVDVEGAPLEVAPGGTRYALPYNFTAPDAPQGGYVQVVMRHDEDVEYARQEIPGLAED